MPSERQNAYKKSYDAEHYTNLFLKMKPEDAELIRNEAKNSAMTNTQFVLMCVRKYLEESAKNED